MFKLKPSSDWNKDRQIKFTVQDPCQLVRKSLGDPVAEDLRYVAKAVVGEENFIDMTPNRSNNFCCGGGGLMLFYEPIEEKRMGQLRVAMAQKAGASVIVTACPFCMINIEDAIKTSGLEGKMEAIDLVELIDRHMKTEG